MYDPCGSQRLDGEDILKRLAKELGVSTLVLRSALLVRTQEMEEFIKLRKEIK